MYSNNSLMELINLIRTKNLKSWCLVFALCFSFISTYSQNSYVLNGIYKGNNIADLAKEFPGFFTFCNVERGYKVTLYTEKGFKGRSFDFFGGRTNLNLGIKLNTINYTLATSKEKREVLQLSQLPTFFKSMRVERVGISPIVELNYNHKSLAGYNQNLGLGTFTKEHLFNDYYYYGPANSSKKMSIKSLIIPKGVKVTLTNAKGQSLVLPKTSHQDIEEYVVQLSEYDFMYENVASIKIEPLKYKILSIRYDLVEGSQVDLPDASFPLSNGVGNISTINSSFEDNEFLTADMGYEAVSIFSRSQESATSNSSTNGFSMEQTVSASTSITISAEPLGLGVESSTTIETGFGTGMSFDKTIEKSFSEVVSSEQAKGANLSVGCVKICPPRTSCELIGVLKDIKKAKFKVTTRIIRLDDNDVAVPGTEQTMISSLDANIVLDAECDVKKEKILITAEDLPDDQKYRDLIYFYADDEQNTRFHITVPKDHPILKGLSEKYIFGHEETVGRILSNRYYKLLPEDEKKKLLPLRFFVKQGKSNRHMDFITVASEKGIKRAIDGGYEYRAILGYIYKDEPAFASVGIELLSVTRNGKMDHETKKLEENSLGFSSSNLTVVHLWTEGYILDLE